MVSSEEWVDEVEERAGGDADDERPSTSMTMSGVVL
jgi:hypothetical protein